MPDEAITEAAAQAADRERERVEQLRRRCSEDLARLRLQAGAGEATAVGEGIKALFQLLNDPGLPRDFADGIRSEIKTLELTVTMKATDMAVRRAIAHAQADRTQERGHEVALARGFLARALALGASEEFKHVAEMSIETAMLTGGVRHTGPTRAKPADEAPPPPSLAKGERREFKRYHAPVLTVAVGDKSFQAPDWSMGGMLVAGSTADEFPHDQPVQIALSAGDGHSIEAMVVQVRVEILRGGLGVKFFQLSPKLTAFLRHLIMSHGTHP